MKHTYYLLFVFLILGVSGKSQAQQADSSLALIPYPTSLVRSEGSLNIPIAGATLYSDAATLFKNEIEFLKTVVFNGMPLNNAAGKDRALINMLKDFSLAPEAYRMEVDSVGVRLYASTPQGMFFALQTLRQLCFKLNRSAMYTIPYVRINDKPAFQWRGMELDVARHFFSKQYLFRFIDLLSYYKFNKLHLHLTDDQGWRIEIKKFPKLTEVGAWREFNNHDSACIAQSKTNPDFALEPEHIISRDGKQLYGGFYTQDDMRQIIAYAASRHIEIIPEIDMPGHMMVATRAYPQLIDVKAGWGKDFSVPLNPAKPQTYTFVQGVLQEIMDLFPGRYVHIGADEVEKTSWEQSPLCQNLMKRLNIKDVHGLQSYFVNRVNSFVLSKGKRSIAWDEVLDGGADPSVHIMYWRGWVKDSPLKAVQRNHPLIMSPTNPMYFDYLPNKGTLASVYDMKVVPDDIPSFRRPQVMGAQANVWTEMIPSKARLEFMILPRMTALAERVWSNKGEFGDYSKRLLRHYPMWDVMGYRYRLPDLEGFADQQVLVNGMGRLQVSNPLSSVPVHYTTDGSTPSLESPVLDSTLVIREPAKIRFAAITSSGAKTDLYQVDFKAGQWKEASIANGERGLAVSFFKGSFKNTSAIAGEEIRKAVISNVALSDTIKMPAFGARIRGFIKVPTDALYTFYLTCDDGGVLKIDNDLVVDNDGQHSALLKSGQVALKAGSHPFAIDFIEAGGGFTLRLSYSTPGKAPQAIPDDWFHQ